MYYFIYNFINSDLQSFNDYLSMIIYLLMLNSFSLTFAIWKVSSEYYVLFYTIIVYQNSWSPSILNCRSRYTLILKPNALNHFPITSCVSPITLSQTIFKTALIIVPATIVHPPFYSLILLKLSSEYIPIFKNVYSQVLVVVSPLPFKYISIQIGISSLPFLQTIW